MPQSSLDVWVENVDSGGGAGYTVGDHHQPQEYQDNSQEQYPPDAQYSEYYESNNPDDSNALRQGGQQTYRESIPDILLLAHFCSEARPPGGTTEQDLIDADQSWDPVREWMRTHSAEEVHAAALQRDEAGKTALHLCFQNCPPDDVIDVFMSIASEATQWPDNFGWLPIHYACAYAASNHAIKSLAEAYPESKTTVDRKGRTPLHFALGTTNAHSAAVAVILSSTGAASYADDNGMLVSDDSRSLTVVFKLPARLT